ncbi:hypothetical protein EMO92_07745 [Bifidobacterium reuteri]|uniref:EpsG family protein n=1 Tax=Bifidobacterium reuteri TaxID=983706 RepID=A0A5J5E7R6_9BIFI|nr:hypothetical protein [Bifidobacterium reuteri]KAA8824913.1 hypothetical protein EMO92_07745 [Bifidobacterium reuteri]
MARGAHSASAKADQPTNLITRLIDRPGDLAQESEPIEQEEREIRLAQLGEHNKNLLLLLVFPVMLVAKMMVMNFLPAKYFFDNNRILSMVNGTAGDQAWTGSYQVATDMFKRINVLDFTTMNQWTLLLGLIFSILVFVMILGADAPDLLQSVFILATVGLLNIYIFNIGKDIIQFAFFFAVYIILMLPIKSSLVKVILSAAVLYYESTFFREYYVLIAALAIGVYAILLFFRSRNQLGLGSLGWIILLMFLMVFAMMIVSSLVMPEEYNMIMGLRSGYVDSFGTGDNGGIMATAIRNYIPGESLPIFMVNYVINLVRMLVPVELVLRGAAYLPFFVFQLMVTAYLVNLLRQINQVHDAKLFIALCVFIGYVLASGIFEPDFGSWTRHESATFPLLLILIMNPLQRVPLTREERLLQRGQGGVPAKEEA